MALQLPGTCCVGHPTMDNVKEAADKAQSTLDKGLEQAANTAKTTVASAATVARDLLAQAEVYWDTAKVQ